MRHKLDINTLFVIQGAKHFKMCVESAWRAQKTILPPGALERAVSKMWDLPWNLKDIQHLPRGRKEGWGYLNQSITCAKMKINVSFSVARSWVYKERRKMSFTN